MLCYDNDRGLGGLVYWFLMPHLQPGSYRGSDYDDNEMSVTLAEETGVSGGNHWGMARCLKAQVQRAPAHLGLRMCCRTPGNYLTHETLFPLVIDQFPLVIELLSGAVIRCCYQVLLVCHQPEYGGVSSIIITLNLFTCSMNCAVSTKRCRCTQV